MVTTLKMVLGSFFWIVLILLGLAILYSSLPTFFAPGKELVHEGQMFGFILGAMHFLVTPLLFIYVGIRLLAFGKAYYSSLKSIFLALSLLGNYLVALMLHGHHPYEVPFIIGAFILVSLGIRWTLVIKHEIMVRIKN